MNVIHHFDQLDTRPIYLFLSRPENDECRLLHRRDYSELLVKHFRLHLHIVSVDNITSLSY